MINPYVYPLSLYRNADYGEIFYFTDDAGSPIDFTGYTGAFQIRRYEDAPGAALASGTVDCTVGGGGIEMTMARAAIDALPSSAVRGQPAEFFYDLRLDVPDATKEDWLRGKVLVFGGITI